MKHCEPCELPFISVLFVGLLVQATQRTSNHGGRGGEFHMNFSQRKEGRFWKTSGSPAKIRVGRLPSEGLTEKDIADHFSKVTCLMVAVFHIRLTRPCMLNTFHYFSLAVLMTCTGQGSM